MSVGNDSNELEVAVGPGLLVVCVSGGSGLVGS